MADNKYRHWIRCVMYEILYSQRMSLPQKKSRYKMRRQDVLHACFRRTVTTESLFFFA